MGVWAWRAFQQGQHTQQAPRAVGPPRPTLSLPLEPHRPPRVLPGASTFPVHTPDLPCQVLPVLAGPSQRARHAPGLIVGNLYSYGSSS